MTTSAQSVSVTEPVGRAITRVKRMLFQPFDLGKWFTIGFCAWLAGLGERGFSANGNTQNGRGRSMGSAHEALGHAKAWIGENLFWLLPLVVAIILIGLALWFLLLWLNSRGRFMFLHCVAQDRAEVSAPWHKYAREANSLFQFRLILWLCEMMLLLPLLVWAGWVGLGMIERDEASPAGIFALVLAGCGLAVVLIACGIVGKFTRDFVAPIQYLRGGGSVAAWRELLRLIGGYSGEFILYVLFSIVLGIASAMLVFAVILATCCIACCVAAIPYIGTVLMLPVLIFWRSYSAYFLAQFGREYDVFAEEERASAA